MKHRIFKLFIAVVCVSVASCERDKVEDKAQGRTDSHIGTSIAEVPRLVIGSLSDGNFSFSINTSEMLDAFTSVSGLNATELTLFVHSPSEIELFFVLSDASGIGVPLVIEDDLVTMYGINAISDKHTCSGDPCSSCKFIRRRGLIDIGLGEILGCDCNLDNVDGVKQKCNHSVSTDLRFEDEDSELRFVDELIAEYGK